MNRKDKRRVARLRMEELHAGKKAPHSPVCEPVPEMPSETETLSERDTLPESETPRVADRAPGFPNIEQQFRPGQTGNPDGYSRRRRIADAFHRALNKPGLEDDIATTAIAMALGQKIPNRTPDLLWFREVRDMVDGSPRLRDREAPDAPDATEETIDPAVITRMLAAADPETIPVLEEDEV
jgi:hypothetical protein